MRTSALAGCLAGALLVACGADEAPPRTRVVTGLIDATEVDVASKLPGRVKEIRVREGDRVDAGQPVAEIESQEIAARMDQVTALVDAARARLDLARKGVRIEEKKATRDQVEAARHQVEVTRKMYERAVPLLEQKALSQAKFDEIEFRYNVARDQLAMAEAKLQAVTNGARKEELEALEALVRQGEGGMAEVSAWQKETVQAAPIAGVVSKVHLHKGELAATGYPILTVVDLSDVWAGFAVREDRLSQVAVGTVLQVEVPALKRTVPMKVFHLAVMGDFATWRATSEKDSFDLKTFEVRARPESPVEGLRPGMTARWTAGE